MAPTSPVARLDQPARRVLVAAPDPWVRFRLQKEFEQAGCEVVPLAKLHMSDVPGTAAFDVIVTDTELFPGNSRLEALRSLRSRCPNAKFVLLTGPNHAELGRVAEEAGFELVLDRPVRPRDFTETTRTALAVRPAPARLLPTGRQPTFDLVESQNRARKTGSTLTSLVLHCLGLVVFFLIPMIYIQTLDIHQLAGFMLIAPSPPPPPPPPPTPDAAGKAIRRVKPVLQTLHGKLLAPSAIPREVAEIVDPEDVQLEVGGVVGGVPGGVPGGQLGGVIGGVVGAIPTSVPAPLPPPQEPIRVGGHIQPPRLVRRVEPVYPAIAKQARISGAVRIDAIISETGRVQDVKILTGHPLLVQAALEAVRQWVYEPTYLNNQPIAVVLEVTVEFQMGR